MDGYTLSRNYFDWSFENPSKNNPTMTALYFFIIEIANRMGWKKEFSITPRECMEAIGINSYNTYKKNFDSLIENGFIQITKKSTNQYQANIIALSKNDKALDKALDFALSKNDKAMLKHSHSTCDILKPLNNKLIYNIENIKIDFDNFRKIYPGTKRGLDIEFDNFRKKHTDYESIIPNLIPILEKQISWRKEAKEIGKFVPEWPMLSTWINQKRWETEFEEIKTTENEAAKTYTISD